MHIFSLYKKVLRVAVLFVCKGYIEIQKGIDTIEELLRQKHHRLIEFVDGLDNVLAEGAGIIARAKLGEVPEAISFSYIAKKYFGKSRGWLMQKVNGNTVNGKRLAFTETERKQFRAALQDISNQLSTVAQSFQNA